MKINELKKKKKKKEKKKITATWSVIILPVCPIVQDYSFTVVALHYMDKLVLGGIGGRRGRRNVHDTLCLLDGVGAF